MAVSVSWKAFLTIVETLDAAGTAGAPTAGRKIIHSDFNQGGLLDANTTVPATKCAVFKKSLSGGSGSIDLTSLPGVNAGTTVDFTGLKLQSVLLHNPVGNASILIVSGASNGYTFGGVSTFRHTLTAGSTALFHSPDNQPDVSSTVKTFDLTGTTTQQLYVSLAAG